MNRKIFIFIFIFLLFANLHAVLNDRIAGNRIPSLIVMASLEESNMLYNAPLIQYLNLDFGLMVNRFQHPGMKFGIDWQWLDGENIASTFGVDGFLLTNRHFSGVYIGAEALLSLSAGVDFSGFKGEFLTIINDNPTGKHDNTWLALELRLGAYISPSETFNIYLAPAVGKYFIKRSSFYFNLVLSTEIFLWK